MLLRFKSAFLFYKNVQFAFETQIDNSINFIDLTINRIVNDEFKFNIYRKSTQPRTINPNDSNHSFLQKCSYLNSLLYRLKRILL